jgi:hypothetical protein
LNHEGHEEHEEKQVGSATSRPRLAIGDSFFSSASQSSSALLRVLRVLRGSVFWLYFFSATARSARAWS